MLPGLARSMMCGKVPVRPLRYGTSETGHHAAADSTSVLNRAPTAWARLMPSPVVSLGASVQCSRPVGVCGNSSLPALDVVGEAAGSEHDAACWR